VGTGPRGLAVAPNGSRVYVANNTSGTVSVIDTATAAVLVTINVGAQPWGVAVTPDNDKVYVVNQLSNTVSVIGAASHTVVATIPVGNHPQGVSVSTDGSKVYVANYVGNTLSVIDPASNTVTATVPLADGSVAFGNFIAPSNASGSAVDFFHAGFGHYFITAYPGEAAAIDAGQVKGWVRTGLTFPAKTVAGPGLYPVCRFFSTAFAPKSSHFYTPYPSECESLKAGAVWAYEADAFFLQLPDMIGNCATDTTTLYRLYNNGMSGAPNHRYTNNRGV